MCPASSTSICIATPLKPQLQVIFDRAALARAGSAWRTRSARWKPRWPGRVATTLWEGERPVPVRLMLPLEVRDDADKIGAVTVVSESGARVPIRDLATMQDSPARWQRSTAKATAAFSP